MWWPGCFKQPGDCIICYGHTQYISTAFVHACIITCKLQWCMHSNEHTVSIASCQYLVAMHADFTIMYILLTGPIGCACILERSSCTCARVIRQFASVLLIKSSGYMVRDDIPVTWPCNYIKAIRAWTRSLLKSGSHAWNQCLVKAHATARCISFWVNT